MNILFVCTGNTCRSAMAEALAKKLLADSGISNVIVSSCGTAAAPVYRVPPVVIALMKEEGIDISAHKPVQITAKLIKSSDIILVMDECHKRYICSFSPDEKSKVFLLKEYLGEKSDLNIPDPIGNSDEFYRKTKEELKQCIIRLIKKLKI